MSIFRRSTVAHSASTSTSNNSVPDLGNPIQINPGASSSSSSSTSNTRQHGTDTSPTRSIAGRSDRTTVPPPSSSGPGGSPASTFSAKISHIPHPHIPHPHAHAHKHSHSQVDEQMIDPFSPSESPEKKRRHLDALDPSAASPASSSTSQQPTASASSSFAANASLGPPASPSATRTRSPKGFPRTPASPSLTTDGGRKKHSPRAKNGTSGARMESAEEGEKRRSRIKAEKENGEQHRSLVPGHPPSEDDQDRRESLALSVDEDGRRDSFLDDDLPPQRNVNKVSPLAKRLGEEPPFMLPHPSKSSTSQTYPGVVIGSFAGGGATDSLGFAQGMGFEGGMDDILDPMAAPRSTGRQGSTGGQAAPNIAPWLMDDEPSKTPTPTQTPGSITPQFDERAASKGPAATVRDTSSKKGSLPVLNHFSSVPSLPKIRRPGAVEPIPESSSTSRAGSNPSIHNLPGGQTPMTTSSTSIRESGGRSRNNSNDSLQTLSAVQRSTRGGSPAAEAPQALHHQASKHTGGRIGRFGSTASNVSGAGSTGSGEKKKGFLGGLLKRRTGPSVSAAPSSGPQDFGPSNELSRTSTGSASSKLSNSPSIGSLSTYGLVPDRLPADSFGRTWRQGSNYVSEGAISPLQEVSETPFHLDMNLDDMEGIVDPTKANVQPTVPHRANTSSTAQTDATSGSMALQDALMHTSSFATTVSGGESSGSSGSNGQPSAITQGRTLIGEAERLSAPFVRNPFSTGSSVGSLDGAKPATPPSPHTLSPKHHLPPSTQPRRPSQLRNMKMGSVDSEDSEGGPWQPIAPSWAPSTPSGQTMFNDPFNNLPPPAEIPSTNTNANAPATPAGQDGLTSSGFLAPAAVAAAAWAAPESWGVEGDEVSDEDSTTSEEDNWVAEEAESVTDGSVKSPTSPTSPINSPAASKKPPPFGFKSAQNGGAKSARSSSGRPGTGQTRKGKSGGGRPSTAARPGTAGRPGTSGSMNGTAPMHWIRIYRADGSFTLLNLPIATTTAELINILSGQNDAAGKKVGTNMKLYLRERGQDRMLLPSEKPCAIQHRRILQAGYTEAEHPEEIGKEDMAILCRFIWQAPALPIMNPEEESSYDSFEFIDVGRRDLQTIPIFLHLHAHNIIILNVSANPMNDIPLDFIQACTSLKELRMSNMALKRVPNSIRASTTLARLDFSCNRIAELDSVSLNEVETLVSLKVQNNKLTSMPSYFAQMKALKYLNISNNKFESFPSVVCEMSNLVDLDVSFNNITQLPSEMSDLKSLERLALFSNELTSFPPSFSTLKNLRILDVRRNKITDLTAVYALPNLATLQVDHNNIVTLDAQIGANVRQFSVPHNSVTRFTLAPPPNMGITTFLLTSLDLSHGKISTLADDAFNGLSNLVKLNLNFNQFTRLPSTLDRLTNLEYFSCTDNMLASMPPGLGRLQKLKQLNLHNNNLKNLSSELWACGALEVLNVSSNLLEGFEPPPEDLDEAMGTDPAARPSAMALAYKASGIPPAGLSGKRMYLGDNRITDEIFHWVASVPGLKVVNLSFNDIYEIPPDTLGKCDKLEAIYLSGNKLTSLPSEDLEKLVNLKTLFVNGNKLQTLPSELGAIKTLQHLDVGSNVLKYNIANWPYDWNWNWNTALRYLNLSGNKRLEIKPTSAQDMNHASSFRKELSDFTALTQLRVLGLMDVTLRIPSLPDESDEKRVRTSFSSINNMAYGISDMLGTNEHLGMFDLVVPNFRGRDNEALFGMFGRMSPSMHAGKLPRQLQQLFASVLAGQLGKLSPELDPSTALRRTFLNTNRRLFEDCLPGTKARKDSAASFASIDDMFRNWAPAVGSLYRTGSSGAVVYLVDKTLHVGNVGDMLIVISRKGEAELLSKKHDPTEREETARIRRAEAWVSTKGFVNDDKDIDISRAFGYWHNFPAVNAAPETRTRQLTEQDEFVIIGNNALWQTCSYQTAVDIARTEKGDPMMAAQKLRDFAISYGADGSIMVMVVNVSDLFVGPNGNRQRILATATDAATEGVNTTKRVTARRREEVGDRTLNRLQQEIEPPTGQIAIVFTDIVNSTHLWETNPGMPSAIKMHHSLMRRQLRLDGGYEVKTEGDSFMVSFQSVTAALLWCFNCQIGLLSQEWPRELLEAHDGKVVHDSNGVVIQRGLRVRMGVHWGAPECEKDPITRRMDYYGPMVNRAARINASADGGQLMASQDVINEIAAVREYLETADEEALNELQGDLKREILDLRRIGLEVKEMGERKLKGLEVPERLHLLYPKTLSGRLETSNEIRAEVEVNDSRKPEQRMIDIEQVRELSSLTLRLEAVCNLGHTSPPSSPSAPTAHTRELTGSGHAHTHAHGSANANAGGTNRDRERDHSQTVSKKGTPPPHVHLGPVIKEDMSDEELLIIIESLTGRVENALSTLYLKNLGGFASVMAALEQATRIDQKLITHAMSLMNGAFGG
ncbi:adenylate cyclase [Kwoniella heveanensis BCC8398]|uniref:Adenylate cyclase n=1 Tax=Kwoniella heveanensis BCC8398 TaxID=1296120 RepID=A0A1B9GT36_9TREE|nr:adenylate cyclase [Kwoniella heveanensis BCC8398]